MSNNYFTPNINPLKNEQISVFVNDIVSANTVTVTVPILVSGKLKTISGSASRIPAAGPVTYTASLIHNGSSSPITNGVVSIPVLGVIAGQSISATISQKVVVGDSLTVIVGGGNTGAGTGSVAFSIS